MHDTLTNLDWSHIRSFLAVAETGSLTAAARKLRQSQPTLGRHIKAVERALGVSLFQRTTTGFELTEAGRSLLGPAQEMARASARIATLAAGQDDALTGTVRVTASVVLSTYILPSIIAELRDEEPEIEIEIVASDTSENLVFREVDIAIRMYQPEQLDIVARKIGDQKMALYAAHSLLQKNGEPTSQEDLMALPFVGFDRSELIIQFMRQNGFDVDRHFFAVRCDDQAVFWQLVCAGCGIGAMQMAIGEAESRVKRLDLPLELPSLPIWLAAHEGLPKNQRVRRVWDFLTARLGSM